MDPKKLLGREIAKLAADNQVIGLGTGSTANEAIIAIGDRVKKEALNIYGVPTSNRSGELAQTLGITIIHLGEKPIDWGFDGADEVEKTTLNILKGGGGAMTREKSIAKKCGRWIVMVDESKIVDKLGTKFPIPIEVQIDQMTRVIENLYEKYQPLDIIPRKKPDGSQYLTDFGNPVLDIRVVPGSIKDAWEKDWEMMPGVVGTGLFLGGYPDEVWIGKVTEEIEKIKGTGKR